MKTLVVIRHAKTEQLNYGSTKTDYQRELKPRGFKDCQIIANQLSNLRIKPDLVLSSSAKRAKQTAQLLSEHLNYDRESIEYQRFIYDGYTTSEFIDWLSKYGKDHDTLFVVGHNPEIAMLAINLTNDDLFHFPTCATAVINFEVDNWKNIAAREGKVKNFIYPSLLK